MSPWQEFKSFLVKQNMLALALAVVVGTATNGVVKSIVDGFIMPIIGRITPGGGWMTWQFPLGPGPEANPILLGAFLGQLLNFAIVAMLAWQITKWIIKPAPPGEAPATRPCPYCKQAIDPTATRCPNCTSEIAPIAA